MRCAWARLAVSARPRLVPCGLWQAPPARAARVVHGQRGRQEGAPEVRGAAPVAVPAVPAVEAAHTALVDYLAYHADGQQFCLAVRLREHEVEFDPGESRMNQAARWLKVAPALEVETLRRKMGNAAQLDALGLGPDQSALGGPSEAAVRSCATQLHALGADFKVARHMTRPILAAVVSQYYHDDRVKSMNKKPAVVALLRDLMGRDLTALAPASETGNTGAGLDGGGHMTEENGDDQIAEPPRSPEPEAPSTGDAQDDTLHCGSDMDMDKRCVTCGSPDDAATMLLCDKCDCGQHMACARLPEVPEGDWCGMCLDWPFDAWGGHAHAGQVLRSVRTGEVRSLGGVQF